MKTILTLFGLGYTKFSASTSSLIALVIYYGISRLSAFPLYISLTVFFAILTWSMVDLDRRSVYAISDPKEVIVDEFLGMFVCCIIAASGSIFLNLILFVAFRALDILKPFPFSAIEKQLSGKYGLLWDDIVIGIVIATAYRALSAFHLFQ